MNAKQCKAKGGRLKEGKCVLPRRKSVVKSGNVRKYAVIILIILALGFVSLLMTNLGTILHEAGGHMLAAKILGCKSDASANFYVGSTTFYDCPLGEKTEIQCSSVSQCDDADPSTNDFCGGGVCVHEKKTFNIIIGLASIFVVFLVAMALWTFFDKNSVVRVLAVIMLFYSVVPSAYPNMPGGDMSYVISQGFNIFAAWIIFLMVSGIFLWVLTNEVTDTQFFKRWVK